MIGSARGSPGLTGTRGIARSAAYKGDEVRYAKWKAKYELIKWAAGADQEDVDVAYPNNKLDALRFAFNLYSVLVSRTEDDPFRSCHSVNGGEWSEGDAPLDDALGAS